MSRLTDSSWAGWRGPAWQDRSTVAVVNDLNKSSSLNNSPHKHVCSKQSFINGSKRAGWHTAPSSVQVPVKWLAQLTRMALLWMWHEGKVPSYQEERWMHQLTHADSSRHENTNVPATGAAEQLTIWTDMDIVLFVHINTLCIETMKKGESHKV